MKFKIFVVIFLFIVTACLVIATIVNFVKGDAGAGITGSACVVVWGGLTAFVSATIFKKKEA